MNHPPVIAISAGGALGARRQAGGWAIYSFPIPPRWHRPAVPWRPVPSRARLAPPGAIRPVRPRAGANIYMHADTLVM